MHAGSGLAGLWINCPLGRKRIDNDDVIAGYILKKYLSAQGFSRSNNNPREFLSV
jgi:hypothetical protein